MWSWQRAHPRLRPRTDLPRLSITSSMVKWNSLASEPNRRALASHSPEIFATTYLTSACSKPFSRMHREIFTNLKRMSVDRGEYYSRLRPVIRPLFAICPWERAHTHTHTRTPPACG